MPWLKRHVDRRITCIYNASQGKKQLIEMLFPPADFSVSFPLLLWLLPWAAWPLIYFLFPQMNH